VGDGGLENAREEIKHFVVDPDGYEALLGARIVAGLVATGRREQAAGKLARALECWNRALALDPQNHDVLKALRKIEGRRRVYRVGVIVGGAALLGGLIWGAFKVAREDVPAPLAAAMGKKTDKPAPPRQAAVPVGPAPTLAQRQAADRQLKGRQGRAELPRPSPPSHPEPARPQVTGSVPSKTFTLATNPLKVEVWLDNGKKSDFDSFARNTLNLEWKGVHRLEVRNDDCCEPFVTEFGPERLSKFVDLESSKIVAVLPRKPAWVTIKLEPPRDDVTIDVRELSDSPNPIKLSVKNGEPVPIPFDAKGELSKRMQVSVYSPGRPVTKTDFDIRAGQKKGVPVPLE